eukprot:4003358-Amphidinium_carterae.1
MVTLLQHVLDPSAWGLVLCTFRGVLPQCGGNACARPQNIQQGIQPPALGKPSQAREVSQHYVCRCDQRTCIIF